jgi:hypothetical protein
MKSSMTRTLHTGINILNARLHMAIDNNYNHMKNILIVAIIASSTLLLFSCKKNSDRLENSTDKTDGMTITMDNPFKLTVEDLRTEKLEVEKKLNELKSSETQLSGHSYNDFKPEIMKLESKIDSLNLIVTNFTTANETEKSEVYDRFKILKEDIEEGIKAIKDRFDDLKVLDT